MGGEANASSPNARFLLLFDFSAAKLAGTSGGSCHNHTFLSHLPPLAPYNFSHRFTEPQLALAEQLGVIVCRFYVHSDVICTGICQYSLYHVNVFNLFLAKNNYSGEGVGREQLKQHSNNTETKLVAGIQK